MLLLFVIFLFIVAALFGLFILSKILKDKPTPKVPVLIHGSINFITLLILISYIASGHMHYLLLTSLGLFLLAAIGGFTLLTLDMQNKTIPKLFAILHPLVAVSGLVTLIIYTFQFLFA